MAGRRRERRRGFCGVLGEGWDGETLHPCKQEIDSFVEKQSPKCLNACKLQYKAEWIE